MPSYLLLPRVGVSRLGNCYSAATCIFTASTTHDLVTSLNLPLGLIVRETRPLQSLSSETAENNFLVLAQPLSSMLRPTDASCGARQTSQSPAQVITLPVTPFSTTSKIQHSSSCCGRRSASRTSFRVADNRTSCPSSLARSLSTHATSTSLSNSNTSLITSGIGTSALLSTSRRSSTITSSPLASPVASASDRSSEASSSCTATNHRGLWTPAHHWRSRNWGPSSSGVLVRSSTSSTSSTSSSGDGSAARFSSTPSLGGGDFGGGDGGGGSDGRGLPPPTIISPVALRVVVIGWMGSSRRYLNKYGSLWARSGDHEVLLLRPSVVQTLVRFRGVVVAGRDIDRVARLHRENPAMPTVYHIFSTGGFIHAGTMWRWMDEVEDVAQRRDLLEEVRGIILDSAPAAVNPDMASRAIVSALTRTPAEEVAQGMPGAKGALLTGVRSVLEGYLRSPGVRLRTEEVYDAWYNLAPACPQLYLYSEADSLVPPGDVERYMAVQEGRGVEVSSHRWSDSGHVEHFRRHPHEYAYQISAFLARALKDW